MSLDKPLEVMMYPDEQERMRALLDFELEDNANIVEFGCGGSTMMFADYLLPNTEHPKRSRTLISVEHNHDWHGKVQAAVDAHPAKHLIDLLYFRPELALDVYGFAHPHEETPAGLTNYLNPMIDWGNVNLVLVDGIARGPCLMSLAARFYRLRERHAGILFNPRIVLHDYTGREVWYNWVVYSGLYDVERTTNMLLELRLLD